MEYEPSAINRPADPFLRGYLDAAEWAGIYDDDEREALRNSTRARWTRDSIRNAARDCKAFQAENAADLELYYAEGYDRERAGMDFYLSRNGHGAGFFDHGIAPVFRRLQEAARVYGSTNERFDATRHTLHTS